MGSRRKKKQKIEIAININSKLSSDIIKVIFSKLHTVNLPLCRIVCKTWNNMVLDYSTFKSLPNPNFFISVFVSNIPPLGFPSISNWSNSCVPLKKIYCVDVDSKHAGGMKYVASFQLVFKRFKRMIVNSCNGLLFILDRDTKTPSSSVLNPMTNEYMKLPTQARFGSNLNFFFYGLGFSLKTKQYKAVRFVVGFNIKRVEICILGRKSKWRPLNSIPSYINIYREVVYLNGAFYQIGKDDKNKCCMYRFDVEDEKFEVISFPKGDLIHKYLIYLQVCNGSLYLKLYERKPAYEIEVWMMMQSYEEGELWIKKFVVKDIPKSWVPAAINEQKSYLQLIKVYENGDMLCLFDAGHLFLYNPKNEKFKRFFRENKAVVSSSNFYQIESLNFDSLEKIFEGAGS